MIARSSQKRKGRHKSHAFAQSATGTLVDGGQRAETEGETLGDCRVGGVTNGGMCPQGGENLATETNTTTGTRKWLTLNGTVYTGKS